MGIVGNYLDQKIIENRGMEGITGAIKDGDFERYGTYAFCSYVSRWSWMEGVAGDVVKAMR